MANILDQVIEVTVGLLVIGYVGTVGLTALINATVGANTGTTYTLVTTVLPILGVVVFLMIVVAAVKRSKR